MSGSPTHGLCLCCPHPPEAKHDCTASSTVLLTTLGGQLQKLLLQHAAHRYITHTYELCHACLLACYTTSWTFERTYSRLAPDGVLLVHYLCNSWSIYACSWMIKEPNRVDVRTHHEMLGYSEVCSLSDCQTDREQPQRVRQPVHNGWDSVSMA